MATVKKPTPPVKAAKMVADHNKLKAKKTVVQAIATVLPKSTSVEKAKSAKRAELKIPKSLAQCADLLYVTKNERLALDKEAAWVKSQETRLTDHLIDNLPKSDASGIAGKQVRVGVTKSTIPQADDWKLIYAEIVRIYLDHKKRKTGQEDGAFSLLQKRLGDAAVAETWAAGKTVPGVKKFTAIKLSINKL